MDNKNPNRLELIVPNDHTPVKFFRAHDASSFVPYHFHSALELIFLKQGTVTLSMWPHADSLSAMCTRLPPLPDTLPKSLDHEMRLKALCADSSQPAVCYLTASGAKANSLEIPQPIKHKKPKASRHNEDSEGFQSAEGTNALELKSKVQNNTKTSLELEAKYLSNGQLLMSSTNFNFALININELHSTESDSYNESYILQIPESFLKENLGFESTEALRFDLGRSSAFNLRRMSSALLNLAIVHENYFESKAYRLHFNQALFTFLECLLDLVPPKEEIEIENNKAHKHQLFRVKAVIDYIRDHYQERIVLEDMAKLVHLHPRYFCKVFKDAVGMSLLNYINEVRLNHIFKDIIEEKTPIALILQKHGFSNTKLFYKIFQERFKMNPRALRQSDDAMRSYTYLNHAIRAFS